MASFTVSEGETREVSGSHHIGNGFNNQLLVNGHLHVTGDTRFVFTGYGSSDSGLPVGAVEFGPNSRVTFANAGDRMTIDQTDQYCGVNTIFNGGCQVGDGKGDIVYEGRVDLKGAGQGYKFVTHLPGDHASPGHAELNRVHWPHGSSDTTEPQNGTQVGWNLYAVNWADNSSSSFAVRNSYIHGFSHNLCYHAGWRGGVTFENCLISACGSRGVTSTPGGTTVRNTTFLVGAKLGAQSHNGGTGMQALTLDGQGRQRYLELDNVNVIHDPSIGPIPASGVATVGTSYDNLSPHNVTVTNCNTYNRSTVTSAGHPQQWGESPQNLGNPMTGTFGGGSNGSDGDTPSFDHTLRVVAESGSGHYEVDFDGEGAPVTSGECATELTSGVGVIDTDGGLRRLNGYVGSTDCDAWEFTGPVKRVLVPNGVTLELDGTQVTGDELKAQTAPSDGGDGGDGNGGQTDGSDDAIGTLSMLYMLGRASGQL